MTNSLNENTNQWKNTAWVTLAAIGLALSACGTSPVQNDCDSKPQILEGTAPWGDHCDNVTRHDPFDQFEGRHGSPNG